MAIELISFERLDLLPRYSGASDHEAGDEHDATAKISME